MLLRRKANRLTKVIPRDFAANARVFEWCGREPGEPVRFSSMDPSDVDLTQLIQGPEDTEDQNADNNVRINRFPSCRDLPRFCPVRDSYASRLHDVAPNEVISVISSSASRCFISHSWVTALNQVPTSAGGRVRLRPLSFRGGLASRRPRVVYSRQNEPRET